MIEIPNADPDPVIEAIARLEFEDGLRTGDLSGLTSNLM